MTVKILAGAVLSAAAMIAAAHAAEKTKSADAMLKEFAADYAKDPMALDAEFGVRIGDDWWRISVERKQTPEPFLEKFTVHEFGPHQVKLEKGMPETPTWYFEFADKSVLDMIYKGDLAAGTGAMRSFSSDKVMVDVKDMEGFAVNAADTARMYHTLTHFWAMGIPEITNFERDKSLPTHGVAAVSLYSMKDKRLAWFSIAKDEAANADPRLEDSQLPNLMIFTKGKGVGDFGDGKVELSEGMSVFIGPYVKHVIYNPHDEPLEGVLVLFGDNIDFAFGKSYLDVLEDQYEFLRDYPFKEEVKEE